jgi:hypothetical protein
MPTLTPVAKEVAATTVDSQDTSLGIALSRSQQHRSSTCRDPLRVKVVDPLEGTRGIKPTLPEAD